MLAQSQRISSDFQTGTYAIATPQILTSKPALYRQIMVNTAFEPGELVIELSKSTSGNDRLKVSLSVVHSAPLAGLPEFLIINSVELPLNAVFDYLDTFFESQEISAIICIGVFNVLGSNGKLLQQIRNAMPRGSRFIIADDWFRKTGPMTESLLTAYTRKSDLRIYSPALVQRILKKHNFAGIEIVPSGATNFLAMSTAQ